ncbi:hypothetical protein AAHH67_22095 [Niallia circulans]
MLSSQEKIEQLLTFIEEEVEIKYPRYFLMESTLMSLMQEVKETPYAKTVQKLSDSIKRYIPNGINDSVEGKVTA